MPKNDLFQNRPSSDLRAELHFLKTLVDATASEPSLSRCSRLGVAEEMLPSQRLKLVAAGVQQQTRFAGVGRVRSEPLHRRPRRDRTVPRALKTDLAQYLANDAWERREGMNEASYFREREREDVALLAEKLTAAELKTLVGMLPRNHGLSDKVLRDVVEWKRQSQRIKSIREEAT